VQSCNEEDQQDVERVESLPAFNDMNWYKSEAYFRTGEVVQPAEELATLVFGAEWLQRAQQVHGTAWWKEIQEGKVRDAIVFQEVTLPYTRALSAPQSFNKRQAVRKCVQKGSSLGPFGSLEVRSHWIYGYVLSWETCQAL
jgi:hypothetical protein